MKTTRAEGILPGGGVALLRSIKALGRLKAENADQKTGIDIVRKALSTPARQIAVNAGEDGSIVVGKISDNETYTYGYDAQEGQYGDMVSKGIIDPTKVVRAALQGAASIAGRPRRWWPKSPRRRRPLCLACRRVAEWIIKTAHHTEGPDDGSDLSFVYSSGACTRRG